MKSILSMTAMAALMSVAGTMVQAEGSTGQSPGYHLQQETLVSDGSGQDAAERFAQLVEERPTAAGNAIAQQEQRIARSEPEILRDRALYGSSSNQGSSQHLVGMLEEPLAAAGRAQRVETSEPDILRHRALFGSSSNHNQRSVRTPEERQSAVAGSGQWGETSEPGILRERVLYRLH